MSDYSSHDSQLSYAERWNRSPMVFRVLVVIGLLFIFYYLAIDTLKDHIAGVNEKSDQLAAQIDFLSMDLDRERRSIIEGATHFGQTTVWTRDDAQNIEQVGGELIKLIRSIQNKYDISTPVSRKGSRDVTTSLPGSTEEVRGISVQVQFTVSPDVLPKILSDIEREPKIARISSVTVNRVSNQAMLSVKIVAEAWWKG